jgi:phosphatidylglycerophosphatase A
MNRTGRFLGSGLGLGLVPWAPGTFGTLGGVAIAWFCRTDLALLVAAAAVFVLGQVLAARLKGADPGWFVLDEVAAYLLVPIGLGRGWLVWGGAFAFFRLFDIAKPWPIRHLERIPGGWGVMLDDLLAAFYAHAALRLLLWLV